MSVLVRTAAGNFGGNSNNGYEQLINYTMLYDEGNERSDVSGGWDYFYENSSSEDAVNKKANSIVLSPSDSKRTDLKATNSFNATGYNTFFFVGMSSAITTAKNVNLWGTDLSTDYGRKSLTKANEREVVLISNNSFPEVYPIIHATGSSITMYACGFVKADDWNALCSKAGVSASSLDSLFADTSALTTIFNNEDAVNFMVAQCTGDFMVGVLNSADAVALLKASPYLNTVVGNPHWAKFIMMIPTAKELLNVTMLYDNGDEDTSSIDGWNIRTGSVTKNSNSISIGSGAAIRANINKDLSAFSGMGMLARLTSGTNAYTRINVNTGADGSQDEISMLYGSYNVTPVKKYENCGHNKTFCYTECDINTLFDIRVDSGTGDLFSFFIAKADDWQTWKDIAGITASSLDTLLADSTAMNALMSNEAAVKYLRGCTGDLMLAICNSETAMQAVVNNIAYDYLFDHPVWYKFMTRCPVALAAMDSVAITVPTMTGYKAPSGEVTGSSYIAGSYNSYPWHAFNKQTGDSSVARWFTQYPAKFPEYVQYDFEKKVQIYKAEILPASVVNNTYSTVKEFVIKASNDNVNFVDICVGTLENQWTEYIPVILGQNEGYRYWRFQINSGYASSDYSGLMELQYYGKAVAE